MVRITITLNDQEKIGLQRLAQKEYRDPRAQAAFIIRKELEKQGLMPYFQPADLFISPERNCADSTPSTKGNVDHDPQT